MKAIAGLARLLAFFLCSEMLPLTRGYFGLGYIGAVAGMLALKQSLLHTLPVTSGFIILHQYAGFAALLWLVYRVRQLGRSALASDVPAEDPGFWFWWPVRWGRKTPLLWLEPGLALVFACFALSSGDMVRFAPLWRMNAPLEACGLAGRCLGWDSDDARWIVQAVAWLPVAALWLNNYCDYREERAQSEAGRKRPAQKPPQPEPPAFSVAGGDGIWPE
jgi:hypothetical protein